MMKKDKSKIYLICLLLFLVAAAQPALGSDWAKFQKNNYNAGVTTDRAPITDPTASSSSWNYSLGGNVDSAPMVAGDMMYVVAGNNHIYAFNRITGSLAWEQSTSGSMGFVIGSAAVGNGIVFVPTTDGKIFAFDAKTGSLKWNKTVGSKQLNTPITYSDGKIYFGEAMGGHEYYCLDEAGNEVWSRTATTQVSGQGSYYWTGAAVIGNSLVYGDEDGHLVSVNKNTGATVAEINVSEEFGVDCKGIRSSILYVEELKRIYFTSKGGYCFSLGFNPADGTFDTSKKYSAYLNYVSTSTPTYYNGRIYMGTGDVLGGKGNGLYCLDANLASVIWNYPVGIIQSTPAISTYYDDGDGEVYIFFTVNSATGGVYCLKDFTDSTSPVLAWSYKDSSKTAFSLPGVAISDGWVYYGTDKKYIFGLTVQDTQNGNTSNQTGNTSNQTGNTSNQTGNTSNQTGNTSNQTGNTSNQTGNTSNQTGNTSNQTGNTSDTWYQFHKDAQHSGYTGSDVPDSANLAWTARPLNSSYSLVPSSSVAIAEGKVFGLCNGLTDEMGNPQTDYGQLVAFKESTGEEVWNVTVSAPEWGSWSSPAYDSGNVFASAGKNTYCVNSSTGKVIWTFHNPTDLASCNGGPAIGDGKVFVSDWDGGNYYCLDENSGSLLWTYKVDGTYAQATPSYKDGKVYFSSYTSANVVYCVNATTGTLIWKNEGFENGPCGSVTISNDGLYVTVFSTGSSDGVYKLDLADGHILWSRSDVSPSDSTPTVLNGKVYLSTGTVGYSDPKTYCLDASDGHTLWETNASDRIGDWACSPAVADGKVFTGGAATGLFTGSGKLYAFDAETGTVIWSYEGCGCSPAVADGMVFSIGGGKIYAFKEAQGTLPEAKFSSNVSSGAAPLTVGFTDESSGEGITTWAWDFENDGTVDSTEQNPVHTYTTAGTYSVKLTVTNVSGSDEETKTNFITVTGSGSQDNGSSCNGNCSSTVSLTVRIVPVVSFEVSPSALDLGELSPGKTSEPQNLIIKNTGTCDVNVTAKVADSSTGDNLFSQGLLLDSQLWNKYLKEIGKKSQENASVSLQVSSDYAESGTKKGEIIFWAEAA